MAEATETKPIDWAARVTWLRGHVGESQGVFADRFGMRRESVLRWENGLGVPGGAARKMLTRLFESEKARAEVDGLADIPD